MSLAVGALAGLTTVVMVLMLGQIRVLYAMGRDGLLPRALSRTGSRGTPVRATVIVGVAGRIERSGRCTSGPGETGTPRRCSTR